MILVLDNYDSFTWNLVDMIHQLGREVVVVKNDQETVEGLEQWNPEGVIISPGPGRPNQSGVCPGFVRKVQGRVPILGVCLGHQLLGELAGAKLVRGPEPVHGKTDEIWHDGKGLYSSLPSPLRVMRYHSLVLAPEGWPEAWEITARTQDGVIMGIRNDQHRMEGVQFHPESILTQKGLEMLRNWVESLEG